MSKLFDAESLMNENLEANATKRDPLPVGETVAQIMEARWDEGVSGPHTKNPGKPWNRMTVKLEITDPEYLSQIIGTPDKATTYLGVMVDMEGGRLATGPNKNIQLGKLRDAADVNGKPLNMLIGQFIRIAVGHKPHYKNPEEIQDEVVSFTKG